MLERDVPQALELRYLAVADDLHLRLVGNGLQVRVQDGLLGVEGLAMTVGGGGGVEEAGKFVLGLWREGLLAFEDDDLVLIERAADGGEVELGDVLQVCIAQPRQRSRWRSLWVARWG